MPRSVLVVDDDSSFRQLAIALLRSWGHDVVGEAGSIAEAVERVTELRPDTVLIDIGLPDGDGFQLTARLRLMPWQPRILLISSDSSESLKVQKQRIAPGNNSAAFLARSKSFSANRLNDLHSPSTK